jgi:hypothetical protein
MGRVDGAAAAAAAAAAEAMGGGALMAAARGRLGWGLGLSWLPYPVIGGSSSRGDRIEVEEKKGT